MEIKEIHWSFACKSRGSFRLNARSPETNLLRKLGKAIRSIRSTRNTNGERLVLYPVHVARKAR
jgi:hypothetical protein